MGPLGAHFLPPPSPPPSGEPFPPSPLPIENLMDAGKASGGWKITFLVFFRTIMAYFIIFLYIFINYYKVYKLSKKHSETC